MGTDGFPTSRRDGDERDVNDAVGDLDPVPERHETEAERLDRNWVELLQELRVTQTGIQLLAGFLLTLPFQARFQDLDPVLEWVFLTAVVLATLSSGLIVAPAVAHRVLFRLHAKDQLVIAGDALAKMGLACLGLTIVSVVTLIFGVVRGLTSGIVAGVCCLLVFALLWLGLPAHMARRPHSSVYERLP